MSLTLTNTAPLPMVSERGQGRACHRQHGERTLDAVQRPTQSKMAEGAAFDALSHEKQRRITDTNSDRSVQVSVSVKALSGNAGPAMCCKASWWDRTMLCC
jgi:hypothetical protein